jgi:putative transposase
MILTYKRNLIWQQEKAKPKEDRILITYTDQQNGLPALKARYPEYKSVYSKVLQLTLRTLDADFKSFFALWKKGDTKARLPKYKGKKYFTTLKYNQSGFNLHDAMLTLSHNHPSKIKLVFRLAYLPAGKVKQLELYQDKRTKHWFVSFNCLVTILKHYDNGLYQAFDTGITNIVSAVNSQGKFLQIKNRRPDKYWKKKITAVQSKRDRCKKFSRKWCWYNTKLYTMVRKLASQLKDFQHKISKVVVTNTKAKILIFGKPNIKKLARNTGGTGNAKTSKQKKTLHYSLQNTGSISRFIELVTYKAKRLGKKVLPINESYTTRICPRCGFLKQRALSERLIVCSNCTYRMDRDLASAINILAKFYLEKDAFDNLLYEPSVNEESFFQQWNGFLRQTAEGKTKVSLSSYWLRFGGLAGSPVL